MDRKTEILSDRKLLNALLEKYGKDDVMQFLNNNFDDDGTYFDTFNKEDDKEREKYYKKDRSVKFLRDNWEPRWNDLISLDSAESVYRYDPDTDSYNTTDITDGLDNDWLETWDADGNKPRYKSAIPVMLFIPKDNFKNAKLYWENLCRAEDKEVDQFPRDQFTINDPCDAFINLWYTKSWGWEAVMSIVLYNFSTPYLYTLHFNLHTAGRYKSMNIYRIVDSIYRMIKNGKLSSDNNI